MTAQSVAINRSKGAHGSRAKHLQGTLLRTRDLQICASLRFWFGAKPVESEARIASRGNGGRLWGRRQAARPPHGARCALSWSSCWSFTLFSVSFASIAVLCLSDLFVLVWILSVEAPLKRSFQVWIWGPCGHSVWEAWIFVLFIVDFSLCNRITVWLT
jgi:hypothetical protein